MHSRSTLLSIFSSLNTSPSSDVCIFSTTFVLGQKTAENHQKIGNYLTLALSVEYLSANGQVSGAAFSHEGKVFCY